jgi:hypothetical protein
MIMSEKTQQEIDQEREKEFQEAWERLKLFNPEDFDAGEVLSDILKIMGVK